MTRDKLYYEVRISKIINNGKENSNIIKKLRRKLRNIEKTIG